MRVLVDVAHPAHVHFFRAPIAMLRQRGHEVIVTSRDKDVVAPLLAELGVEHRALPVRRGSGVFSLTRELVLRTAALVRTIRATKPDLLTAVGGTFVAHAGALCATPRVVFYDTENATLQNLITYPFVNLLVVPRSYGAWTPKRRNLRYRGYQELSYLHPNRFAASREQAIANGLDPTRETFLVRTVGWQANHDIGEHGWSDELLSRVVHKLAARGRVLVSSERALPSSLRAFAYSGKVSALHHVMSYCRCVVGESATMASEAAVLGVPAIYAARTGRGYTDEQEARYGLVRNVRGLSWERLEPAIDAVLAEGPAYWQERRRRLLEDTLDVAHFATELLCRWAQDATSAALDVTS